MIALARAIVYNNGLKAYTALELPSPDRLVDLPRFARAVWTSYDTKGIVARRLVATVACLTLRGRMSAKKAIGEVSAFHCFRYRLEEPHAMMHHNDEHSGTLGHELWGENWGHLQGDYDRRLATRDYHGEVCDMYLSHSSAQGGQYSPRVSFLRALGSVKGRKGQTQKPRACGLPLASVTTSPMVGRPRKFVR